MASLRNQRRESLPNGETPAFISYDGYLGLGFCVAEWLRVSPDWNYGCGIDWVGPRVKEE